MKVFKFGGASVKDAEGIQRVSRIIRANFEENLAVVVSAMGKTTNALEIVWQAARTGELENAENSANEVFQQHLQVCRDLGILNPELDKRISGLKSDLIGYFQQTDWSKEKLYDHIVSIGEMLSSSILSTKLETDGVNVKLLDARKLILTNDQHQEARLDWEATEQALKAAFGENNGKQVYLIQGFIGASEAATTTLGREGSDFTAAILSYCLDVDSMHIWKDVPGILTGDPRLFDNVTKIDRLSYLEAIEMTYYGAKVIHPKTIKPLENKQIPLYVRSFMAPDEPGTLISGEEAMNYPPVVVVESNQCLLHIASLDFSFIAEDHLHELFKLLNIHRIKVNMMRNTAISFTICVTDQEERIDAFIRDAEGQFRIIQDKGLELISIRHTTPEIIRQMKKGKIVLFEESLKETLQMVVKTIPLMERKR